MGGTELIRGLLKGYRFIYFADISFSQLDKNIKKICGLCFDIFNEKESYQNPKKHLVFPHSMNVIGYRKPRNFWFRTGDSGYKLLYNRRNYRPSMKIK